MLRAAVLLLCLSCAVVSHASVTDEMDRADRRAVERRERVSAALEKARLGPEDLAKVQKAMHACESECSKENRVLAQLMEAHSFIPAAQFTDAALAEFGKSVRPGRAVEDTAKLLQLSETRARRAAGKLRAAARMASRQHLDALADLVSETKKIGQDGNGIVYSAMVDLAKVRQLYPERGVDTAKGEDSYLFDLPEDKEAMRLAIKYAGSPARIARESKNDVVRECMLPQRIIQQAGGRQHSHVLRCYGYLVKKQGDDVHMYTFLELLEGEDLYKASMSRELNLHEHMAIATGLFAAVEEMQAASVMHFDLKPSAWGVSGVACARLTRCACSQRVRQLPAVFVRRQDRPRDRV